MDQNTAQKILAQVSYKPGWTFESEVPDFLGIRPQNLLIVHIVVETINSNSEYAPEYKAPIMAGDTHVFDLNKYSDATGFLFALFTFIMSVEVHEAREFFGLGKMYAKPLHPHTDDGEFLWNLYRGVNKANDGNV